MLHVLCVGMWHAACRFFLFHAFCCVPVLLCASQMQSTKWMTMQNLWPERQIHKKKKWDKPTLLKKKKRAKKSVEKEWKYRKNNCRKIRKLANWKGKDAKFIFEAFVYLYFYIFCKFVCTHICVSLLVKTAKNLLATLLLSVAHQTHVILAGCAI